MEFSNLFSALDSEDSIAFIFFILCFFLIGFLIAAIGWGGRARRRKKELSQLKKNYEDLQVEHERIQEQIDLKQADLIRAEREAELSTGRALAVEKEKEALQLEIATLEEENSNLTELSQTYLNNIEALNNQIIGLKTRNNKLSVDAEKEGEAMNQLMDMQSSYNATVKRLSALETKLEAVSKENTSLKKTLKEVKSTDKSGSFAELEAKINQLSKENEDLYKTLENVEGRTSLADLEAKIDKLNQENQILQKSLEGLKIEPAGQPLADLEAKIESIISENKSLREDLNGVKTSTEALAIAGRSIQENPKTEATTDTEEEVDSSDASSNIDTAKAAISKALGKTIDKASREEKNDLTAIKGIGAFIEQKLNAIGLYTYQQISQLDEEMIQHVTTAIEFFPGRIQRDNWVGQAAKLVKKNKPKNAPKNIYPENVEDLKIIEGIGPKIEKLLKGAGISTWEQLAKSDVKVLKTILIEAGNNYRIHDPSTWPMQAQMAADWKWTELKDYQDYLVGGGGTITEEEP